MRRIGTAISVLTLLALATAPGAGAQQTTGTTLGNNTQASTAITLGPAGVTQVLPGGGQAGNFAFFRVFVGGETPIHLTYGPADPIANRGFGVRIYSPTGAEVDNIPGVTDQGGRGIVDYTITGFTNTGQFVPGWYTIQVYNYNPHGDITFSIQGVAQAPQEMTTAQGHTGGS